MERGSEATPGATLVFDPVWLILERPRPNLNPPKFFAPGRLVVADGRAEFGPSDARLRWPTPFRDDVRLTIDRIVGVSRQRYGWGLVPRFVAISYETATGIAIAYFNDGGWNGWRPLLTGANRRIVDAIGLAVDIE